MNYRHVIYHLSSNFDAFTRRVCAKHVLTVPSHPKCTEAARAALKLNATPFAPAGIFVARAVVLVTTAQIDIRYETSPSMIIFAALCWMHK